MGWEQQKHLGAVRKGNADTKGNSKALTVVFYSTHLRVSNLGCVAVRGTARTAHFVRRSDRARAPSAVIKICVSETGKPLLQVLSESDKPARGCPAVCEPQGGSTSSRPMSSVNALQGLGRFRVVGRSDRRARSHRSLSVASPKSLGTKPKANGVRHTTRTRWVTASASKSDATEKETLGEFEDDDDLYDVGTYADLAAEEQRLISAINGGKGGGSVLGVSRAYTVEIPSDLVENALPDRGILEYVRLPAEEYNVLDSDAVTRVGEHTFRVAAGAQKILWLEVEPVGVLSIRPTAVGCEQILKGATMTDAKAKRTGKPENGIVKAMNSSLKDLRMCNRISAVYGDGKNAVKTPRSRPSKIKCQIDISGDFTEGPFAAAGSERLNGLLQWCLGGVMPWFLNQLAFDYGDWSLKKQRGRQVVNVAQVASEILNGTSKGILPEGVAEVTPKASAFEDGSIVMDE